MRIFVLALAILLLPLRGWLGDAMAIQAVRPAVGGHVAHAMHEMGGMTGMSDLRGMTDTEHAVGMSHETHDQAAAPVQASSDCKSACGDCQLCHSVAMALWPALAAKIDAPRTVPVFVASAFASAEPALGLKPPIS